MIIYLLTILLFVYLYKTKKSPISMDIYRDTILDNTTVTNCHSTHFDDVSLFEMRIKEKEITFKINNKERQVGYIKTSILQPTQQKLNNGVNE